jgi:ribosome-binding ATPase
MEKPLAERIEAYPELKKHMECMLAVKGKQYLQSMGPKESELDRLIKAGFELLDLITYLTTGELETRAWTIRKGTNAAATAGKIHSDLEKGIIRAKVVSYEDMVRYHGRVGARENDKAPSEGRDYIVKDGDVILFYHSN